MSIVLVKDNKYDKIYINTKELSYITANDTDIDGIIRCTYNLRDGNILRVTYDRESQFSKILEEIKLSLK